MSTRPRKASSWNGSPSIVTADIRNTSNTSSKASKRRQQLYLQEHGDVGRQQQQQQEKGRLPLGNTSWSESEWSDAVTSDSDVDDANEKDAALSKALISTIERLSVRAALAMCRPPPTASALYGNQQSNGIGITTLHAIDESLELTMKEGKTDASSNTKISTVEKEKEEGASQLPVSSSHQFDLNEDVLRGVDSIAVRAALQLTSAEDRTD
jgi:hypothetical protein